MWNQDSRQRQPFGERCRLWRLGGTPIAPAEQDACTIGVAAAWAKLNDIGALTLASVAKALIALATCPRESGNCTARRMYYVLFRSTFLYRYNITKGKGEVTFDRFQILHLS